jgi:hypothetical protein
MQCCDPRQDTVFCPVLAGVYLTFFVVFEILFLLYLAQQIT